MNTRIRPLVIFALTLTLSSTVARAQSAEAVQMSTAEAKKGEAAMKVKNYDLAMRHLHNSIVILPSSGAYYMLGVTYYELKMYPEAVRAFKEVIRTVPNNAEVRGWLAKTYNYLGIKLAPSSAEKARMEFANAEAEARRAISLKPDHQVAYSYLGSALFLQRKYAEAAPAFQQALRLRADDAGSLHLLGITYARLGKKEEAMQIYRKLAPLDKEAAATILKAVENPAASNPTANAAPGTAGYYFNEGRKDYNSKAYVKAVESFKRAIALKPDVPTLANTYAWLASSYRDVKQYANAIAAAKESLRLRPNNADTTFGLGWSYHLAGQHQNALTTFNEAARLDPNDAETQYWIGEVYLFGLKQPEKALAAYRESLRLSPNDARTINQIGLAYSELEQFQEAIAAFKEAIRHKPPEGLYYSNLSLTYAEMGMKEQALEVHRTLQKIDAGKAKELAERIAGIFPNEAKDDPEFFLTLAFVVSAGGNHAAALPLYRRVILLKPEPNSIAAAYRGMGDAYKQQKKTAKATAAYQHALTVYQRLLRLKPQEVSLHYGLGHTYLGLGQNEQALHVYRKLETLDQKYAQSLLNEINKAK